ncbi:hypothetical protein FACS1894196_3640 [Clostridia bacterium]|nr:hypothetical protein FACS1894196_3640 [Clostridia bacterium]
MADIMTILTPVMAFIALAFTLANGWAAIRARRNAPEEKRWDELSEWRKRIDGNFTSDNNERWLKQLEENKRIMRFLDSDKRTLEKLTPLADLIRVLAHNQLVVLDHIEDGNHTGELRETRKNLEKFLIGR